MSIASQINVVNHELVVGLSGSMTFRDFASADGLLSTIFQKVGGKGQASLNAIVFDLADVSMIDSHWLGMFVKALKQAEPLGLAVALRAAQPSVARLLELVQFKRVFRIEA